MRAAIREHTRGPRVSRTFPTMAAKGYCPTMPLQRSLRVSERGVAEQQVYNVRQDNRGELCLGEVVMLDQGRSV